jgi:diguanylate cyclase (GGDEF)-like protein
LFTKENIRKGIAQKDMAIAVDDGRCLFEREYVRKNKTKFWGNGLLTSTRDKQGKHQGFSNILRDATEQNDLHKTALHNSTHDFLTGLPNRNFVEEDLIKSLLITKKTSMLAVFYMDFNNFKRTNDELGHGFGDLVLIEIAHRLSRSIRISDTAARFGGDEFVIVAKNLMNHADVTHLAKKILGAFRPPIIIKTKKVQTSVSMGIALFPNDGKRPSDLFRFSDMALYQAKKLGGNQFQFYTKDIAAKKNKVVSTTKI